MKKRLLLIALFSLCFSFMQAHSGNVKIDFNDIELSVSVGHSISINSISLESTKSKDTINYNSEIRFDSLFDEADKAFNIEYSEDLKTFKEVLRERVLINREKFQSIYKVKINKFKMNYILYFSSIHKRNPNYYCF